MASYVAHQFQHQRKESTLFEGLSCLMGAVHVNTCQHVCAAPMAAYLVRNESHFKFSVEFKYIPLRELASLLQRKTDRNSMTMAIIGHENGCFLTNEVLHYIH